MGTESTDAQLVETARCYRYPFYFVEKYVHIEDATLGDWIPFGLWPAQASVLAAFAEHRLTAVLKARQLGLTWLVLAWALWLMLFRPSATVLLFSRRDDEAVHMLDRRLKGMAKRLPAWMQPQTDGKDNEHWEQAYFEKENGDWRFLDAKGVQTGPYRREEPKIGRNDPCSCGSGQKYKKCHGK